MITEGERMDATFCGLIDIIDDPEGKRENHPKSFTTIIDHTMQTEYEEVVDRPLTPVAVYAVHRSKVSLGNLALWDTGSRTSCISKKLAKQLQLQCVGTRTCITPAGNFEAPTYYIDIQIADELRFENVLVTEYPLENHDCDVLIGMDIISRGRLVVDTVNGKTTLSFSMK